MTHKQRKTTRTPGRRRITAADIASGLNTQTRRARAPKTPKPDPQARPAVADEQQAARNSRDAIARLYGHGTTVVQAPLIMDQAPLTVNAARTVLDMEPLVIGEGATVEEIPLAPDPPIVVDSPMTASNTLSDTQGVKTMATVALTYKGPAAKGKIALYKGLRTVQRIEVSNFPGKKPPQTLTFSVDGEFAGPREIKPKQPKLTKAELKARREQRKAERKNETVEQRIQRIQAETDARIARLKAQAEKDAAAKQAELQPA